MNYFCYLDSPIDPLLLISAADALTGLHFAAPNRQPPHGEGWIEDAQAGVLPQAAREVREYFAGTRRIFDVPLRMNGTDFQRQVWRGLKEIPFGATWSYGQLAKRLQNPNACRAVGLANGRNPIAIIVPCHRVIGADGSLTGFGGGLHRKQWLLAHEGHQSTGNLQLFETTIAAPTNGRGAASRHGVSGVVYSVEANLGVDEFARVLVESGLGVVRPVDDLARLEAMLRGASLLIAARGDSAARPLLGVLRALSDGVWCCYVSELAVSRIAQGMGVGKGLLDAARQHLGPQVSLILISMPEAVDFYEHIGMPRAQHAYWYRRLD